MTEERAPYYPLDPGTRLKLLGFRSSERGPGMSYEMDISEVKVTASVGDRHLNFLARRVIEGKLSEMEVGIPVGASLAEIAEVIAHIMKHFLPEPIDWDYLWAFASLFLLKTQRPSVLVNRQDLRRALKALKQRLPSGPLADARLEFDDCSETSETSYLRLQIGNAWAAIPASGVWVGTIWVKTPALLGCLKRRFAYPRVRIWMSAEDDCVGHRFRIGNSEMRGWWEPTPEPQAT